MAQQVSISEPLTSDGDLPVSVQDQTTTPIDVLFAQSVSNFTLATDAVASTATVLSYDLDATAGHGISPGDEIALLEVAEDKFFYATVLTVDINTITVDRPIDHAFDAISTLGRIVITNMAVDGSVTPQIFTVRAGSVPYDFTRFILQMSDSVAMDTGRFGGVAALSRGFVFRFYNGVQRTIFNFKTNGDIAQFCYDVDYIDKAPAGEFGLTARLSFGGQSKHGVVIRLSGDDVLQWVVQDDLTDLLALRVSAQGHEVTD